MTKEEILDETIAFYSEDTKRRALKPDGKCAYNTEDGRHCAVGRCLKPSLLEQGTKLDGNGDGVYRLVQKQNNIPIGELITGMDNLLDDRYHGHSIAFWRELQEIHDRRQNWSESGLTEVGLKSVKYLREKIKRGVYN